ncbi:RGCVC family protein [Saccharothrix sp.]|uniref:RGCVC family protein n=1 Tax=Saccharothrix sp. TaxID=1873460 RepID=UPI0028121EAE|nr:RGCVC family protein [Saccharothrix sp.]
MSTTDGVTDHAIPDATGEPEPPCPVCPHPVDAHDPISRRFCAATEAGGMSRGCLCSGQSSGATYGRSGYGSVSDRTGR